MRKNSRSDLAINERFFARSEQGELIATDVPDRVRIDYFTPERKRVWTCSRNGDEYHDCSLSPDGKSLVCRLALSRVYLGEGPLLKVVRTVDDDPAFPASVRKSGFLASTGIDLWAGPPESGEVESSVIPDTVLYGYSAYRLAVLNGFDGTEQEWLESLIGPQGKSAYQVAVENGYEGTVSEWLASLVGPQGKSAYRSAVDQGYEGTEQEWIESLIGPQGKSAYQVAVENGYEGTVSEWLASLVGQQGKSAYQVAVDNGFEGTEQEWLTSLVGPSGKSAYQLAVDQGYEGTLAEWLASLKGPAGDSAYQIAVQEGFIGTKAQWLASLVGPQGMSAYQVAVVEGFEGSVSEWLASLVGPVGPPGVTSCHVSVDNTSSSTPTATAHVENGVLYIEISGIKGIQGNPGVGYDDVETPINPDGTVDIILSDGSRMTLDLNHNHPQYYDKLVSTEQPAEGLLPDVTYELGTLTGAVTISLAAAASGHLNHYFFIFSTGSAAPTVTFPPSVTKWAGNCVTSNAPAIGTNRRYEVSILDGVGFIFES